MSYVEKGDYKAALNENKQSSTNFVGQSKFLIALIKAGAGESKADRALITDSAQHPDAQVKQRAAARTRARARPR